MSSFLDVPGVKPAGLDAAAAALLNDPASALRGAGNATYAPASGSTNYAPATGSGTYETQSHAASTYATPAQAAGAAAGLAIVFGGL